MKIAVLISSLVFDSQKAFMKGIERRVRDMGDSCHVFSSHVNVGNNDSFLRGEHQIFRLPDLSDYDGIVYVKNTFMSANDETGIDEKVLGSGKPCVCIDYKLPGTVTIMTDESVIIEKLVDHLVSVHNVHRLGFLGGYPESSDAIERFKGFKRGLEKNGIEYDERLKTNGNFEYYSGVEAADFFLNIEDGLPEAIVCANDEMAIGLCNELKKRGVRIPKQVKITGVDYDSVSRIYYPRITTVKRQQYQKGVQAINVLHEFDAHTPGECIVLDTPLVPGESCGCQNKEEARDVNTTNMLSVDRYSESGLTQIIQRMTADLMARKDYKDLLAEIKNYACIIKPDELYICMNETEDLRIDYTDYAKAFSLAEKENHEEYSQQVDNVISVIKGRALDLETEKFDRRRLLPPSAGEGKPGGTYYFFSIHYMNRNFGYAILGTSGDLVRNDFFPNWVHIVGNAFENSRKRAVMVDMIEALDHMWIYDTLTGVYNRAGFYKLSEPYVKACIELKRPICVIFVDVDGLKQVNDRFGHDEGDVLIKNVADSMKEARIGSEVIMRYGGDEFVMLSDNYSEEQAQASIERIERNLDSIYRHNRCGYEGHVSIGYCRSMISSADELPELVERADHQMYIKKKAKRGV